MTPEEYAADEAASLVPDMRNLARYLEAETIKLIVPIVDRLLDSQPRVFPGPFVRLANVLHQDIKKLGLSFDRFEEFDALQSQACSLVVEIHQRCKEEKPKTICLADPNGKFRTQRGTKLWHLPGSKLVAQLNAVADDLEAFVSNQSQKADGIPKKKLNQVAELEATIPPLDKSDGTWVKNTAAARLENVETRTLSSYRNKGVMNESKTLGRDVFGRQWRRDGTPGSHPWYLRSTLVSVAPAAQNRR